MPECGYRMFNYGQLCFCEEPEPVLIECGELGLFMPSQITVEGALNKAPPAMLEGVVDLGLEAPIVCDPEDCGAGEPVVVDPGDRVKSHDWAHVDLVNSALSELMMKLVAVHFSSGCCQFVYEAGAPFSDTEYEDQLEELYNQPPFPHTSPQIPFTPVQLAHLLGSHPGGNHDWPDIFRLNEGSETCEVVVDTPAHTSGYWEMYLVARMIIEVCPAGEPCDSWEWSITWSFIDVVWLEGYEGTFLLPPTFDPVEFNPELEGPAFVEFDPGSQTREGIIPNSNITNASGEFASLPNPATMEFDEDYPDVRFRLTALGSCGYPNYDHWSGSRGNSDFISPGIYAPAYVIINQGEDEDSVVIGNFTFPDDVPDPSLTGRYFIVNRISEDPMTVLDVLTIIEDEGGWKASDIVGASVPVPFNQPFDGIAFLTNCFGRADDGLFGGSNGFQVPGNVVHDAIFGQSFDPDPVGVLFGMNYFNPQIFNHGDYIISDLEYCLFTEPIPGCCLTEYELVTTNKFQRAGGSDELTWNISSG